MCCSSLDESRTCLRFCETLFTVGVSPDLLGNGCTMLWILHICINSNFDSRRNETSGIIKLLSLIKGQEKDSGRSSERCSEQPQKRLTFSEYEVSGNAPATPRYVIVVLMC